MLSWLCTAKDTTDKMKRQTTEQEKIFTNDMTENKLIFKIYKQLLQFNIKKQIKGQEKINFKINK